MKRINNAVLRYIRISEIARLTGWSTDYVRKQMKSNDIPFKAGRMCVDDLKELLTKLMR